MPLTGFKAGLLRRGGNTPLDAALLSAAGALLTSARNSFACPQPPQAQACWTRPGGENCQVALLSAGSRPWLLPRVTYPTSVAALPNCWRKDKHSIWPSPPMQNSQPITRATTPGHSRPNARQLSDSTKGARLQRVGYRLGFFF